MSTFIFFCIFWFLCKFRLLIWNINRIIALLWSLFVNWIIYQSVYQSNNQKNAEYLIRRAGQHSVPTRCSNIKRRANRQHRFFLVKTQSRGCHQNMKTLTKSFWSRTAIVFWTWLWAPGPCCHQERALTKLPHSWSASLSSTMPLYTVALWFPLTGTKGPDRPGQASPNTSMTYKTQGGPIDAAGIHNGQLSIFFRGKQTSKRATLLEKMFMGS